ncbi:Sas10/Utp3/C1D family-domain-containing protein [Suillus bovinus]|uniref:Sas10/Utp3/C1D family-domain-containing protein n=1 Tax=Suillus bovinus TaxID=48563 RepID=UPI001B866099|nr:Sas10/Utp3/C1D family-domain-containing protein [Suillus bovinus]KAG2138694.1 Sas10/Utp3/C1D family-domain-containing protein [Suillus bovinus]
MASDEDKLRAKVAKLNTSLDELETQLEPLFTKSLPETLVALETIQQAKLQVILPYVLYDLVFVYLKTRGIDPKTHPVIGELDRVRQYFDKIKSAEDSEEKKRLGIDKAAANRFIKHAIAQAKLVKAEEPSNTPHGPASTSERVPVKITSKMAERAEYEKNLQELGSEEEEDLEVFVEAEVSGNEDAMEEEEEEGQSLPPQNKGKSRMVEKEVPECEEQVGDRRKRQRIDPFAASGYGDDDAGHSSKSEKLKQQKKRSPASALPIADSASADQTPDQSGQSTHLSAANEVQQRKAGKKARREEKKSSS